MSLESHPSASASRTGEFKRDAGFAYPGLPNQCDDLAMSPFDAVDGLAECGHLRRATDEVTQSRRRGGGLKSRAPMARRYQRIHRHWFLEPFDRYRPERLDVDEILRRVKRRRRDEGHARPRELFHSRGEMGRLTHGGIIHVKVVADG